MAARPRGSKPLKRRTGARPELKTVVIFCEGSSSEPDYINGVKKLAAVARSTAVRIEIDPRRGVPLTLVRRAVARKRDPEVDDCWCVFDVEWPKNHPNLSEAVELARAHNIGLAISNPCFELWLILHHRDYGKFADTDVVERESRSIDGRSGKSIDAGFYMPLREHAVRRALALAARHEKNGTVFPRDNPSSSMPALLAALEP